MTLPVAGQVGPAVVADGVTTRLSGKGGVERSSPGITGPIYEAAFRGNLFSAA